MIILIYYLNTRLGMFRNTTGKTDHLLIHLEYWPKSFCVTNKGKSEKFKTFDILTPQIGL